MRSHTFGDAVEEWLRHREVEKRLKARTLAGYRGEARRYMLPLLGADTPLDRIRTEDVDAMRRELLERGLSPKTVQSTMVALHGVFARASRIKWIKSNPATDAERVAVRRSRDITVLEPEQVFAVARACPVPWHAAAIQFAAFTGLRLGEPRGLRWRDVDFAKRAVRVVGNVPAGMQTDDTPKGHHGRVVPLVDQAAAMVDALSRRPFYLGPTTSSSPPPNGDFFTPDPLRRSLYKALDKAELGYLRERRPNRPPFTFHDLRHTFGTLAARVFPLRDVQAFMGHEQIATTEIYLHHVPQHDAADKLTALLAEVASTAVVSQDLSP